MSDFALDARLAADCLVLGDLALSRVLLLRDSRYPWLILVPRRPGAVEILDLDAAERGLLMEEAAAAAAALRALHAPDKLNLGALGNLVPQLHLHVIARRRGDAAWPGPVWGQGQAVPYGEAELAAEAQRLKTALGISVS